MADYVDNDLSILFRQNLGSLFTGSAEKSVTGLYQDLLGWYAENIPAASGNAVQPEPAYVQKEESSIDLFGILITILVIVILFKIIFRPRRRYYDDGVYYGGGPRPGFWSGMFWGSMLGRNRGHRPPPPPGPRPGYRPPSADGAAHAEAPAPAQLRLSCRLRRRRSFSPLPAAEAVHRHSPARPAGRSIPRCLRRRS